MRRPCCRPLLTQKIVPLSRRSRVSAAPCLAPQSQSPQSSNLTREEKAWYHVNRGGESVAIGVGCMPRRMTAFGRPAKPRYRPDWAQSQPQRGNPGTSAIHPSHSTDGKAAAPLRLTCASPLFTVSATTLRATSRNNCLSAAGVAAGAIPGMTRCGCKSALQWRSA